MLCEINLLVGGSGPPTPAYLHLARALNFAPNYRAKYAIYTLMDESCVSCVRLILSQPSLLQTSRPSKWRSKAALLSFV